MPFGHVERFAGFDACLCFEAGQLGPDGRGGGRRPAQGARGRCASRAYGREAHSGSAPEKGANALLALADGGAGDRRRRRPARARTR